MGAPVNVLYEDNHLLVVEKPVNMPVQADASGDADLLTLLKGYIKEKYEKPGEVYLGLVHRLDRPVGGVMVFARTSKAAARLTEQFRNHTAKKRYAAVVTGTPMSAQTLTDWLVKDADTFSSRVVAEGTAEAKLARLRYERIGCDEAAGTSLLDVELFTGRPHQIRVQLAHAGLPIVGDQRYNPAAQPGEQIALTAYALTITHPTLQEPMTFTLLPHERAFARFPAQVSLLPAFAVCRGVYMDDELLVVDKCAGVETDGELTGQLRSLLGEVFPVHRLDANTQGLVAFALGERARERLVGEFALHAVGKAYHAIVCGVPERREGRLVHFVQKDADSATVRLCREGDAGALRCELGYRVLATAGDRSLVEIELFTGRTHQIRVQMAAIGHPVLGDDKYGDREANKRFKVRAQQLLSKRLTIDGHTFLSLRELAL